MRECDPVKQTIRKFAAECSKSEHCSGEMIEKMRRWKLTEEQQAQVMAYLTENKYIDDARFARLSVRDKLRFNTWGPRKIEQSLWMKHVDEDVYRPFLDEITAEEWQEVLIPLLQSKRRSMADPNSYEAKMKLIRFAMGRGFTMDVIDKCLSCNE